MRSLLGCLRATAVGPVPLPRQRRRTQAQRVRHVQLMQLTAVHGQPAGAQLRLNGACRPSQKRGPSLQRRGQGCSGCGCRQPARRMDSMPALPSARWSSIPSLPERCLPCPLYIRMLHLISFHSFPVKQFFSSYRVLHPARRKHAYSSVAAKLAGAMATQVAAASGRGGSAVQGIHGW